MKKMYPAVGKYSSWFCIFLFIVCHGGEVPTDLKFDDEVRNKDENGNENGDMVEANANSLVFTVVVPLSTNPDLGHSNCRSTIDSGDFERALADDDRSTSSAGAESFLIAFNQEFGDL